MSLFATRSRKRRTWRRRVEFVVSTSLPFWRRQSDGRTTESPSPTCSDTFRYNLESEGVCIFGLYTPTMCDSRFSLHRLIYWSCESFFLLRLRVYDCTTQSSGRWSSGHQPRYIFSQLIVLAFILLARGNEILTSGWQRRVYNMLFWEGRLHMSGKKIIGRMRGKKETWKKKRKEKNKWLWTV